MKLISSISIVVICLLLTVPETAALEYSPIQSDGETVLVISGEFSSDDDPADFLAAVARHGATVVTFNSPGGSVGTALRIGRAIRLQGLKTVQLRTFECASACAFAFMGGVERWAQPGSIGMHRTSLSDAYPGNRNDAASDVQHVMGGIIEYLGEMGIDAGVLKFALSTDSNDMRYLSLEEMRQYRIVLDGPSALQSPLPAESTPLQPETTPLRPEAPEQAMMGEPRESGAIDFVRALIEESVFDSALHVPDYYADNVFYFDKYVLFSEILEDKRSYYKRWPNRSFRIDASTIASHCALAGCVVSGEYDFVVKNYPANKMISGRARFEYLITSSGPFLILSENGKVTRRY